MRSKGEPSTKKTNKIIGISAKLSTITLSVNFNSPIERHRSAGGLKNTSILSYNSICMNIMRILGNKAQERGSGNED
jgi:hypothetical protein